MATTAASPGAGNPATKSPRGSQAATPSRMQSIPSLLPNIQPVSNRLLASQWQRKRYELHLRAVRNAVPGIDNSCPMSFDMWQRLDPKKAQLKNDRQSAIAHQNEQLLAKFEQVYLNTHLAYKTNEAMERLSFVLGERQRAKREKRVRIIEAQNQHLAARLQLQQGTYRSSSWEDDRLRTLQFLINKSMHKSKYVAEMTELQSRVASRPVSRSSGQQQSYSDHAKLLHGALIKEQGRQQRRQDQRLGKVSKPSTADEPQSTSEPERKATPPQQTSTGDNPPVKKTYAFKQHNTSGTPRSRSAKSTHQKTPHDKPTTSEKPQTPTQQHEGSRASKQLGTKKASRSFSSNAATSASSGESRAPHPAQPEAVSAIQEHAAQCRPESARKPAASVASGMQDTPSKRTNSVNRLSEPTPTSESATKPAADPAPKSQQQTQPEPPVAERPASGYKRASSRPSSAKPGSVRNTGSVASLRKTPVASDTPVEADAANDHKPPSRTESLALATTVQSEPAMAPQTSSQAEVSGAKPEGSSSSRPASAKPIVSSSRNESVAALSSSRSGSTAAKLASSSRPGSAKVSAN